MNAILAQLVEHILGKDEVVGSNPIDSSNAKVRKEHLRTFTFNYQNTLSSEKKGKPKMTEKIPEIILASASPRRQELLKYIVPEFSIIPADIDETLPDDIPAEEAAEFLAVKKAKHISEKNPAGIVIGSDTVVVIDGEILGKPKDTADAERMLRKLSGKTHSVITGVCISCGNFSDSFSCRTFVKFFPLTDEEIHGYIATGEPMDKAGAYGIQGKGCLLAESIDGDFFNVVGLPASLLKRHLEKFIVPLHKM